MHCQVCVCGCVCSEVVLFTYMYMVIVFACTCLSAALHTTPPHQSSAAAAAVAGLACMFPYCTAVYGPHEVEEFEAHELSHF